MYQDDRHKVRSVSRIAAASGAAFVAIIFLLWRSEQSHRFPIMQPGVYLGYIDGMESARIPVRAYVGAESRTVSILPLRDGALPLSAPVLLRSSLSGEAAADAFPLPVRGRRGEIKLAGNRFGPDNNYRGTVLNSARTEIGSWELRRESAEMEVPAREAQEWLSEASRLEKRESERRKLGTTLASLKAEIARVKSASRDESALEANARIKEKEETDALNHAIGESLKLTKQIEQLRKQLDLAQRLSPGGRLVQLSRDTLRKEESFFMRALNADDRGEETP